MVLGIALSMSSLHAERFRVQDLPLKAWSVEFLRENKKFDDHLKDKVMWKGTLCNGGYDYDVHYWTTLDQVDFELTQHGTLQTYIKASELGVHAKGGYWSEATFCSRVKGWLGVSGDWAQLWAEIKFGPSGDLKDMTVKIQKTYVNKLELGNWVPNFIEKSITGMVNRVSGKVWASRLGDWISRKISEFIKKKMPEDEEQDFS